MSPVNAPTEATQGASRKQRNKRSDGSASDVIKVKVEPLSIAPGEDAETYWCGTLPGCPMQNVTVGGQNFPLFVGTPTFGKDGQPDRDLTHGAELDLSDRQVEAVMAGVANRVLRRVGSKERPRGMIITRDGPYRMQSGDEPLGKHMYMKRGRRGHEFPEPMVD